jgi:hypothetical protein
LTALDNIEVNLDDMPVLSQLCFYLVVLAFIIRLSCKDNGLTMSIILAILGGSAVGYMLYKLLFDTLDEFMDCVRFWFTPDINMMKMPGQR